MSAAARARAALGALAREPLVHFAVLGALVFAVHRRAAGTVAPSVGEASVASADAARSREIVLTREFVAGLAQEQRAREGRAPSDDEVRALVAHFVDEEVLYREALALGLDRGDAIVRRRLAQKLEFLAQDTAIEAPPTDAELQRYLQAHAARYADAPRTGFTHVYFSSDAHGAQTARRAERARAGLLQGRLDPARTGDPFAYGSALAPRTESEIAADFGEDFARAVIALPAGTWSAPIASRYGLHLVRVDEHRPAAAPSLATARARVLEDFSVERRESRNRAALARLRARYTVRIEGLPSAAAATGPTLRP